MNRKGSLLIESLVALMLLAIALIFIGRGLGPLKRMTDDAVIQQDLLDLGASVADQVLSGVITDNSSNSIFINGKDFYYNVQFDDVTLDDLSTNTSFSSTVTSTVALRVANATISTVDIVPVRTLHFSVFPYEG